MTASHSTWIELRVQRSKGRVPVDELVKRRMKYNICT